MTEKLKAQQREYDAQMEYRKHVQEFIDKFRFNAKRASLVQSRIKQLEKLYVERKDKLIILKHWFIFFNLNYVYASIHNNKTFYLSFKKYLIE